MTFICCWSHLEAAVVSEAAQIKARSQQSQAVGGSEVVSATITISGYHQGKCQVCGADSVFSVYFNETYRVQEASKKETP